MTSSAPEPPRHLRARVATGGRHRNQDARPTAWGRRTCSRPGPSPPGCRAPRRRSRPARAPPPCAGRRSPPRCRPRRRAPQLVREPLARVEARVQVQLLQQVHDRGPPVPAAASPRRQPREHRLDVHGLGRRPGGGDGLLRRALGGEPRRGPGGAGRVEDLARDRADDAHRRLFRGCPRPMNARPRTPGSRGGRPSVDHGPPGRQVRGRRPDLLAGCRPREASPMRSTRSRRSSTSRPGRRPSRSSSGSCSPWGARGGGDGSRRLAARRRAAAGRARRSGAGGAQDRVRGPAQGGHRAGLRRGHARCADGGSRPTGSRAILGPQGDRQGEDRHPGGRRGRHKAAEAEENGDDTVYSRHTADRTGCRTTSSVRRAPRRRTTAPATSGRCGGTARASLRPARPARTREPGGDRRASGTRRRPSPGAARPAPAAARAGAPRPR